FGLAVSGDFLYASNTGDPSGTIVKYTTSGALVNSALISGLSNPIGIAISGNDLYVANWSGGTVGRYTTSGATVNANLLGLFSPPLNYPGGLALDNLGHLLVSTIDDGVKEYTTGGVPVNPALTAPGYNSATGILLDGNGHLFVANNYGGEG